MFLVSSTSRQESTHTTREKTIEFEQIVIEELQKEE